MSNLQIPIYCFYYVQPRETYRSHMLFLLCTTTSNLQIPCTVFNLQFHVYLRSMHSSSLTPFPPPVFFCLLFWYPCNRWIQKFSKDMAPFAISPLLLLAVKLGSCTILIASTYARLNGGVSNFIYYCYYYYYYFYCYYYYHCYYYYLYFSVTIIRICSICMQIVPASKTKLWVAPRKKYYLYI